MQQRGFTLLEAMVVVAIMAVLAMVAAPGLGVWMDNLRIRGASDALQQGIQTAKAEAIRRNQNVTFWLVSNNISNQLDNSCELSSTSGSWVVSVDSPAKLCATAPSATGAPRVVARRAVGDTGGAISVEALQNDADTPATSITFNSFGRVVNPGTAIASIDLTGPQEETTYKNLRIQITGAGQVRLCEPAITTTGDPRKCEE